MRSDGRRPDYEEFSLSGIDTLRSDHPKVQLVVLRGLQELEKTLRFEYTNIEELSADEGVDVLLVVQKGCEREGLTIKPIASAVF